MHYHFIGIGGIGMSALARFLLQKGEKVSGSDLVNSSTVQELECEGAKIFIGHKASNVGKPHVIVYSTGIPQENPEFLFAKESGVPLLHRSELLANLLEGYAPLLVTGTHGKTTTSSLLTHVLVEGGLDPSFAIGGILQDVKTNGHFGKGPYFTVEADESDGSFLNYPGFGAIITNLEHDHMDYWQDEKTLLKAFSQFAAQVGSKNHLFWCYDDRLLKSLHLKGYSYGFDEHADLVIENFSQIQWKIQFDVTFQGKKYLNLELPLIGAHNVLNASAVFGLALKLDLDEKIIRKGFLSFKGVGRRAERKGEFKQIEIYDDYAHHPTEIFSTLRAMKSAHRGKRIIVAFQPHRYTRTKYCIDDFADAFTYADQVILTDIYAASEKPIPGISSEKMLDRIKADGFKSIHFVERGKLTDYLGQFLKPGDVLVTMGAGDITHVGPAVLEVLKTRKTGFI